MKLTLAVTALLVASTTSAMAQLYKPSSEPQPMALRQLGIPNTMPRPVGQTIRNDARTTVATFVSREQWGAKPTSGTVRKHFPIRLTLHHEASPKPAGPERKTIEVLRNLQRFSQYDKPWCDVPYHFFVDTDGTVYEGRPTLIAGDTNTKYDPAGHFLVCVLGNYEIQTPTKAQIDSIVNLMAWGCETYGIDPGSLTAHMDHAQTQCPGKYLFPYVASGYLEGEIRKTLKEAYTISKTPKKSAK